MHEALPTIKGDGGIIAGVYTQQQAIRACTRGVFYSLR
jgi:hypothetical protein